MMKVEKTEITSRLNSYITVIKRDEPYFQAPFHYHPEVELVYITESYGKRIIGNSVEHFNAGDMVFLGSNIPHVWLNDEVYYRGINKMRAKCIVVYFNKDIFGSCFYELKEVGKVAALFDQAARGLNISGKTNSVIAQKLNALTKKKDFEIIVGLFEILSILSESKDLTLINKEPYVSIDKKQKNDRLSDVFKYINMHYADEIHLDYISKLANLTPQSFCRVFKAKTKKRFVEYLNEVRVSNACKQLIETDMSISEIAYQCGYKTVSNFNKLFKKISGITPKEYKAKINTQ
jgi:AraC-like DNA-binding protein